MKKIKFLKSKFYLTTSFVLGTFSSLILAACEPIQAISNTTTPTESEPDLVLKEKTSNEKEAKTNTNPEAKIENESNLETETGSKIVAEIEGEIGANTETKVDVKTNTTAQQKEIVAKLFAEPSFLNYLDTSMHEHENSLNTNINLVVNVGVENQYSQNNSNESMQSEVSTSLKNKATILKNAIKDYVTQTQDTVATTKLYVAMESLNNLEQEVNKIKAQLGSDFKNPIILNAAFGSLKKELKSLSFIKALELKNVAAIDLFASHVQDPVYADVVKLNQYVSQGKADIQNVWATNNLKSVVTNYEYLSLKKAFQDLVDRNNWYGKAFISNNNQEAEIITLLSDALKTPDIQAGESKVINDFLTEFQTISPFFIKLYNSFFNLKSNTSVLGLANQLIKSVDSIDVAINKAQDLGSVLETIAIFHNMEKTAKELKNILPPQEANVQENPAWLNDLIELHTMRAPLDILKWDSNSRSLIESHVESQSKNQNPNFDTAYKALGTYNFTTSALANKMMKILKIQTNGSQQGYLKDVNLKLERVTQWFSIYSNNSINNQLDKLIELAEKLLDFIDGNETTKIINDLAQTYNNKTT